MKVFEAVRQMRQLTENGIPFSISFVSLNNSKRISNGLAIIDKCMLRSSRPTDKDTLIAYTDLTSNVQRFFHLPLLLKFNDKLISNEY